MKIMKDKVVSASLIYRKIEGELSVEDEKCFKVWLEEKEEHQEFYERMRRMYQEEKILEVEVGKVQDAWNVFEKRMKGEL